MFLNVYIDCRGLELTDKNLLLLKQFWLLHLVYNH